MGHPFFEGKALGTRLEKVQRRAQTICRFVRKKGSLLDRLLGELQITILINKRSVKSSTIEIRSSANFCSTKLKFSFRASNPNGIMLYTANEPSQTNFIECHLEESTVKCSFSSGGGTLKLKSSKATYSDGKWHTVCTTCFRFITTILVKTFGALCFSCKKNAIQVNRSPL